MQNTVDSSLFEIRCEHETVILQKNGHFSVFATNFGKRYLRAPEELEAVVTCVVKPYIYILHRINIFEKYFLRKKLQRN